MPFGLYWQKYTLSIININKEKARAFKYCQEHSTLLHKAFQCHDFNILLFLLFLFPEFIFFSYKKYNLAPSLILGDIIFKIFIYSICIYFIKSPEMCSESREMLAQ